MAKDEAGSWNIVQGITVEEHTFLAAHHRASRRTREVSLCRICAHIATVSPLEGPHLVGIDPTRKQHQEEEALQLEVRCVWGANTNGEHPTVFWWCSSAQTQKKRQFSGHMMVPQGLCENLINALKLLTNQQRDGDCPIQNIGTEWAYCERFDKLH